MRTVTADARTGFGSVSSLLAFFTSVTHCHYSPFVLSDLGMRQEKYTGDVTMYMQVAEASCTVSEGQGTAAFTKSTTAQHPSYSAQILACRCVKSCVKYVTAFWKSLLLASGAFPGLALLKVGTHAVVSSMTRGRLEHRQHIAEEWASLLLGLTSNRPFVCDMSLLLTHLNSYRICLFLRQGVTETRNRGWMIKYIREVCSLLPCSICLYWSREVTVLLS